MSRSVQYNKLIQTEKWHKIRNAYIKQQPLCERCRQNLATEVHHIKPLEDYTDRPEVMEQLAYDVNNLQALCHKCHFLTHWELKKSKYNRKERQKVHKRNTDYFLENWLKMGENG